MGNRNTKIYPEKNTKIHNERNYKILYPERHYINSEKKYEGNYNKIIKKILNEDFREKYSESSINYFNGVVDNDKINIDKKQDYNNLFKNTQYLNEQNIYNNIEIGDIKNIIKNILENLLITTKSEFGLIGKVVYQADNKPYLETLAISDMKSNRISNELYNIHKSHKFMFNTDTDTLFGKILRTNKYVIYNETNNLLNLPPGHPTINKIIGIPIIINNKIIGIYGLANSTENYTVKKIFEDVSDLHKQLLFFLSYIINIQDVHTTNYMFEMITKSINILLLITTNNNNIIFANEYFCEKFSIDIMYSRKIICMACLGRLFQVHICVSESTGKNNNWIHIQNNIKSINNNTYNYLELFYDGKWYHIEKFSYGTGYLWLFNDITVIKDNEILNKQISLEKEFMLADLSHQLKTPLHTLSLMLNEDNKQETKINYNRDANIIIEYINNIVHDILYTYKYHQENINTRLNAVVLEDFINPLINFYKLEAEHNNIKINYTCKNMSKLSIIKIYDNIIRHTLMNLLSNAIKYTNENGTVCLEIEKINDKQILLRVKDNGRGMTDDIKNMLGQPFLQSDHILSFGIGIYTIKKLLNKVNIELKYESEKNRGTTFWFIFPYENIINSNNISSPSNSSVSLTVYTNPYNLLASSNSSITTSSITSISSITPFTASSDISSLNTSNNKIKDTDLKVCIVDDTTINRKLAVKLITNIGIKKEFIKDFSGGIDFLTYIDSIFTNNIEELPHIIFMDILMPNINGIDTIKEYYKKYDDFINKIHFKPKIYFMTALQENEIDYGDLKIDGIIFKPFTKGSLLDIIKNVS